MYLSEWLFNSSNIKILFGERDSIIHKILVQMSHEVPADKQTLVIDVKRQWQANHITSRTKLLYVSDKEELLKSIFNLQLLLSPRLSLILVDGLPFYLRDFLGRELRKGIINTRSYAACMILLNKLVEKGVRVVVSSYSQTLNQNLPIMHDASTYYGSELFRVKSQPKNEIVLQAASGDSFILNL
ncbi:MAG: hypothetical protein ACXAB7_07230 [Candidatus Kariarchaeaceae archaeon]|jgi:hypothetical protein